MSAQSKILPVLSYATGAGWQVVGQAKSLSAAKRVVKELLPDSSRTLINRYGFKLSVTMRTDLQRELNGGLEGYVWSVGK